VDWAVADVFHPLSVRCAIQGSILMEMVDVCSVSLAVLYALDQGM